MGPFGFWELIFLFFIALVIFGPKKLPDLGKSLGKGLREFKKASDELKSNWEQHIREADTPVNDLKQTFADVQRDVESATQIEEHSAEHHPPDAIEHHAAPAAAEHESAPAATATTAPEEKKPDAH